MRASSTRLAAVLALALLVTGCGGASPTPSPVVESPASAAPSPSVAPTLPAEAKGTTPESAKAFVGYYLAALTYASQTGDTSELARLGVPDCVSCQSVIDQVRAIYDAGGHLEGDGYSLEDPVLEDKKIEKDSIVRIKLINRTQTLYTSPSASPSTTSESQVAARFRLTAQSDHWVVAQWTRV